MYIKSLFQMTPKEGRRYILAFWLGIITGIISAMVKSGSEGIVPPRTPDRAPPPFTMLKDMGFDPQTMIYHFSGHTVNWGGNLIHYLFSIVFAVIYCIAAEIFPKIKLWQGILVGLGIAVFSHGILLPIFHLSPAPWDLPMDEIISEIIGTSIWMWVIEVMRRDLRNRWTHQPDPEYYGSTSNYR